MDFIINLIIIGVILYQVLTRMKELNQKSGELGEKRPEGTLADMLGPDETGNSPSSPLEPQPRGVEVVDEVLPEPRYEERYGQQPEPIDSGTFTGPSPEPRYTGAISDQLVNEDMYAAETGRSSDHGFDSPGSMPSPFRPVTWKQDRWRVTIQPLLKFDDQQVLNGIVMSEVLGPPLSLRDERRTP